MLSHLSFISGFDEWNHETLRLTILIIFDYGIFSFNYLVLKLGATIRMVARNGILLYWECCFPFFRIFINS